MEGFSIQCTRIKGKVAIYCYICVTAMLVADTSYHKDDAIIQWNGTIKWTISWRRTNSAKSGYSCILLRADLVQQSLDLAFLDLEHYVPGTKSGSML